MNNTIEIQKITGCICDSLTINNVEEMNLTDEQRLDYFKKFTDYIINTADNQPGWFNYFLQWFIDLYATSHECITDKPCDCCGDMIYKDSLIINQ